MIRGVEPLQGIELMQRRRDGVSVESLADGPGKLTEAWVQKWLADPKGFKAEARMPKFWFNTNNSGVSNGIDWDKRTIAEINAVADELEAFLTGREAVHGTDRKTA